MKTMLHYVKVVLGKEQPYSQVTEQENELLMHYAKDQKVVVEIGSFEGKTTLAFAHNTKGQVYAVDPFFSGRIGISYSKKILQHQIKQQNIHNITLCSGLSYEVAKIFNESIDFIFIDADHSYEGVSRDWDDWFPKLKANGFIALHDSKQAPNSPNYLGSMKFYDEDIPQKSGITEVATVDSLVILKKQ